MQGDWYKGNDRNYKDGEENGKWTWYYENGQKMDEVTYKDGIMISKKE